MAGFEDIPDKLSNAEAAEILKNSPELQRDVVEKIAPLVFAVKAAMNPEILNTDEDITLEEFIAQIEKDEEDKEK